MKNSTKSAMNNSTNSDRIIVQIGHECGAGANHLVTIWEGLEDDCPWDELDQVATEEGMVLVSCVIEEDHVPENDLQLAMIRSVYQTYLSANMADHESSNKAMPYVWADNVCNPLSKALQAMHVDMCATCSNGELTMVGGTVIGADWAIKPAKYMKQMVHGGNIRVTQGDNYIGTYMTYYDMTNSITDLDAVGSEWL